MGLEVAHQRIQFLDRSEPGTIRIESLACASGIRTFDEPAMVVMSTPIAEMDGLRPQPSADVPGAGEAGRPSSEVGAARKSSAGKSRPSQSNRETPSIGTFPSSSWSVAEEPASAIIASGAGPPNTPGVERVLERAHRHHARDIAAERGRERRLTDPEVAHVADDEDVGREQLGVRVDEGLQVALRLLHALDDQLHRAGGFPSKTLSVPRWIASPPLSSAAPRP